MNLTRKGMIDMIEADDSWLNRAVMVVSEACATNNSLPQDQRNNLDYWSGWIKTKRNLTGQFRLDAVRLVTSGPYIDILWDRAVTNTTKGNTK